jgi:hypothetical protein
LISAFITLSRLPRRASVSRVLPGKDPSQLVVPEQHLVDRHPPQHRRRPAVAPG